MDRSFSLHSGAEFQAVWEGGKAWSHPLIILRARSNGMTKNRYGFVAGKKVGKAVRRNRAKRLLREAVRRRLSAIERGWDLIFIARSRSQEAEFRSIDAGVAQLLQRAKLVK